MAVTPTTVATLETSELYEVIVDRGPAVWTPPVVVGDVVPAPGVDVCPGVAVLLAALDWGTEEVDEVELGVVVECGIFKFGGRSVGGDSSG